MLPPRAPLKAFTTIVAVLLLMAALATTTTGATKTRPDAAAAVLDADDRFDDEYYDSRGELVTLFLCFNYRMLSI